MGFGWKDFLGGKPESHVDATQKTGSYREAGANEPSLKKPAEVGDPAAVEAYQKKVYDAVQEYMRERNMSALKTFGDNRAEMQMVDQLRFPYNNIKKALKDLALEESEPQRRSA